MKKLNIFIIFVVLTFQGLSSKAKYVEIVVKIQDEIITNLDIENEKKYLIFLNPKLKQLNISRLNNIAKDSLVTKYFYINVASSNNELIKTMEVLNFPKLQMSFKI